LSRRPSANCFFSIISPSLNLIIVLFASNDKYFYQKLKIVAKCA
jgi:hypothetical protein